LVTLTTIGVCVELTRS